MKACSLAIVEDETEVKLYGRRTTKCASTSDYFRKQFYYLFRVILLLKSSEVVNFNYRFQLKLKQAMFIE